VTANSQYTNRAEERLKRIERRLRISLNWTGDKRRTIESLLALGRADPEVLLSAVDLLLAELDNPWNKEEAALLEQLYVALPEGSSAWRVVRRRGGVPRLERVVQPELEDVAETVIAAGGRPAEYLRQAWERAFGREPNADGAYRDAVRALEAALAPIVVPKDLTATLGKIIEAMRDKPSKFVFVLKPKSHPESALALADLLGTVWTAQLDRHGAVDESVPLNDSIEEARAAAQLAAVVVNFVRTGAIKTA